jgi:murein DD-endopeptidase MepM/ murein hydrolase activator NlpD
MVPAVLLLSVSAALGGLAVLHGQVGPALSVTAAAASAPMVLTDKPPLNDRAEIALLDQLDNPPIPTVAPPRPHRASRVRHLAPVQHFFRPGVGPFTSGFKWRWGRMHTGIDLAGPYGSPVVAVTDGVVIEAGSESGYGNMVKIEHPDGVITYYAHLSRILITGGHVRAGQEIAEEGDTGHSTGPHLHFEVRIDGTPVDPVPWLAGHGIYL